MSRRRDLRPEERELWELVARSAQPMHPEKRKPLLPPLTAAPNILPPANPPPPPPLPRIEDFKLGSKAPKSSARHDIAPTPGQLLKAQSLMMDAQKHRSMTRGKLAPEARLDLHGMTLSEAHSELIAFVLGGVSRGMRLLLVITGKGKDRDLGGPIPTRMGALRHQVPQWLRLPPLGPVILQVSQAHLRHGGEGAYYVYLKRLR